MKKSYQKITRIDKCLVLRVGTHPRRSGLFHYDPHFILLIMFINYNHQVDDTGYYSIFIKHVLRKCKNTLNEKFINNTDARVRAY